MNALSEKLRTARKSRGFSLEDIAALTRIQRRFLEAIEEGRFSVMPRVYLRAFLRSYAKAVGLDDDETLRDLEQIDQNPTTGTGGLSPETEPGFLPSARVSQTSVRQRATWPSQKNVPVIVAGLLIASLVASLMVLNGGERTSAVKEIPFPEVVKQREGRDYHADSTGQNRGLLSSSPTEAPGGSTQPASHTPLILRAMTFDSVWISILIDGKFRKEYRVPPRWSGQWKASENFVISLSNASAVSLTLNNNALGMIGIPGKPVRNYLVQHSTPPETREPGSVRNE